MLIKYNTTGGFQILESKAKPIIKPGGIVQQNCLLLFLFHNFSRIFIFFPFSCCRFQSSEYCRWRSGGTSLTTCVCFQCFMVVEKGIGIWKGLWDYYGVKIHLRNILSIS